LFQEVPNHLDYETWVYLIGGENLRLKGYKDSTKDCDLAVTNVQSFKAIISALERLGYISPERALTTEDLILEPSISLEHPEKIKVDIFMMSIMRAFYISESMIKRSRKERFVGKHILHLAILQDEDVFILKCASGGILDTAPIVKKPSFNWNVVWLELGKQEKDTGYHLFNTILCNINFLLEKTDVGVPSFYNKLILKNTDEKICRIVRKGVMHKEDLLQRIVNDRSELKLAERRVNRLIQLKLIRQRKMVDGRIRLRPGKSNVLRYADQSDTYDMRYLINYNSLLERIWLLCSRLHISTYFVICKDLARQISKSSTFISRRIHNLGPAIIYFVVRLYKLPVTRTSIADMSDVSKPSLTDLCHQILEFVNKNKKEQKEVLTDETSQT
jgi:hypothetical protein